MSYEVKELEKGRRITRQSTSAKPWWICLIGALSFCLWGSNVLPVQHLEYKLTANLAISQHRMPMLHSLAGQHLRGMAGTPVPLSGLEILPEDTRHTDSLKSDLRSVRVKVRCPIRGSIKDVEKYLADRTVPSMETNECQEFAKQLHLEKWLLESCLHSLKRLELDSEHDKNAKEVDDVALQDSVDSKATSPFRLMSFRTRDNSPPTPSLLENNLQHLARVRSENLESMATTLERLKANARGFLSMTGSPVIAPVVGPLTASRLFALFICCVFVWLLLMMWVYPVLDNVWFRMGSREVIHAASNLKGLLKARNTPNSDFNKTMQWLQREGIPYLGAIHVITTEGIADTRSLPLSDRKAAEVSTVRAPICDQAVSQNAIKFLRGLSEGSLVLWIGLFVARLLFDPIWRELVTVAPLAAICRMISGIQ